MENAKHHPNTGKVTKTKTSSLLLSLRGVDSQKIHKGLDWITEPTKVGFEGWDLVKTLQCQKSTTVSEIARQVEISILPIWELAHQQLVFNVCFLVTYRRSHGGIVSCSLPASISLPPCLPPFQLVGLDRRSLLQRHPWRRCRQCKSDCGFWHEGSRIIYISYKNLPPLDSTTEYLPKNSRLWLPFGPVPDACHPLPQLCMVEHVLLKPLNDACWRRKLPLRTYLAISSIQLDKIYLTSCLLELYMSTGHVEPSPLDSQRVAKFRKHPNQLTKAVWKKSKFFSEFAKWKCRISMNWILSMWMINIATVSPWRIGQVVKNACFAPEPPSRPLASTPDRTEMFQFKQNMHSKNAPKYCLPWNIWMLCNSGVWRCCFEMIMFWGSLSGIWTKNGERLVGQTTCWPQLLEDARICKETSWLTGKWAQKTDPKCLQNSPFPL